MRKLSIGLVLSLIGCGEFTAPVRHAPDLSIRRAASVAAPEAILPAGFATVMGNSNNNFPHASHRTMRYQQVFLGGDLVDPRIVGLCLRRDDTAGSFQRDKTLTIRLGPTLRDHTTLGTDFAANYSALPTEVFSGSVVIPEAAAGGTPVDFDFCIPFTQEYGHPAGSNVIVEVLNTSLNLSSAPRDACTAASAACTTARAWALSPTATVAAFVEREGLIMKFISPEPPAPVDPVSHEECMKGGWSGFDFRNQGQCIRFVETGFDSRLPVEDEGLSSPV